MAGFRPGSRVTFLSGKVTKAIDAPSGLMTGAGRKSREGEPTRRAQTRLAGLWARPLRGPDGRRRTLGDKPCREPDEKTREPYILYDPACSLINFLAVGFGVGDDFGNACRKLIAKYIWHVVH